MSSLTFDKCPLCANSRPQKLYGTGVCWTHFQNPKAKVEISSLQEMAKAEKVANKTLDVWFKEQLAQKPKNCECCNKPIRIPSNLSPKTAIAHIFPKSVFKSVKTHPDNRWFANWQCHTDFDNATWSEKMAMPIWPKIEERVKSVINSISKSELKHLPEELRALLETTK